MDAYAYTICDQEVTSHLDVGISEIVENVMDTEDSKCGSNEKDTRERIQNTDN